MLPLALASFSLSVEFDFIWHHHKSNVSLLVLPFCRCTVDLARSRQSASGIGPHMKGHLIGPSFPALYMYIYIYAQWLVLAVMDAELFREKM
jgi:hypothetical protein